MSERNVPPNGQEPLHVVVLTRSWSTPAMTTAREFRGFAGPYRSDAVELVALIRAGGVRALVPKWASQARYAAKPSAGGAEGVSAGLEGGRAMSEAASTTDSAPDEDGADEHRGYDMATPTGSEEDSPPLLVLLARVSEENEMRRFGRRAR